MSPLFFPKKIDYTRLSLLVSTITINPRVLSVIYESESSHGKNPVPTKYFDFTTFIVMDTSGEQIHSDWLTRLERLDSPRVLFSWYKKRRPIFLQILSSRVKGFIFFSFSVSFDDFDVGQ